MNAEKPAATLAKNDRGLLPVLLTIGVGLCGTHCCRADEQETLRQLAERKGVVVGAMILDGTWQTAQQQALVSAEFGAATVGTFWTRTRPQPGVYDWAVTDAAVQWADSQGMGVHLHPLLYPADQFNPQWVRDQLDSNPETARDLLRDHITTAMNRYKGVVDVWDVVNEAVDPSGGYRPSKWKTALESIDGVDNYVVEAFRIARDVDPNAVLLYNEHDIELSNGYQSNKWFWTRQVLDTLIAENLVDGLGWQLHTTPDEVLGSEFALAERMQWVRDRGLKNFVTELDMEIPPEADLDRQGEAFDLVTRTWLEHSGGGWLQTWGVYDGQSWLGAGKRPLLFDEQYQPKPAYDGVRDALNTIPDAGDFNGDARIDALDLQMLAAAADAGPYDHRYDLNGDGVVNFLVTPSGVASDSDYLVRVLLATEYGDVNLDGVIDATDFSTLVGAFGSTTPAWASGNLNGDAVIDATDYSLLVGNFGFSRAADGSTAQAAVVPEPAGVFAGGLLLANLAGRAAAGRRRVPPGLLANGSKFQLATPEKTAPQR